MRRHGKSICGNHCAFFCNSQRCGGILLAFHIKIQAAGSTINWNAEVGNAAARYAGIWTIETMFICRANELAVLIRNADIFNTGGNKLIYTIFRCFKPEVRRPNKICGYRTIIENELMLVIRTVRIFIFILCRNFNHTGLRKLVSTAVQQDALQIRGQTRGQTIFLSLG